MFHTMAGTLIVAVIMAAIVFVAAFAAEGRGQRLIRMMLGEEKVGSVREHLYDEVERPEASLDVVGALAHPDTRELSQVKP